MRILMLGNSFTFYNDMPQMLAKLTGAEVAAHTRGGAWLSEQLNPETEMGQRTLTALEQEQWDYVVMQEQSHGAITAQESFLKSVAALCEKARAAGAVPVLYATWAYARDCDRLAALGLGYDEMARKLNEAYHLAAEQNDALVAEVGMRFHEAADALELYTEDRKHPNPVGSLIAAKTLASVITDAADGCQDEKAEETEKLRRFMEEEIQNGRVDVSWAELRKLIAEPAADGGQEET